MDIPSSDKLYEQAIDLYTNALDLDPTVAVYYGNRSIAYLKTESYGYALIDASRALELDPAYIKVCACVCMVFVIFYEIILMFSSLFCDKICEVK